MMKPNLEQCKAARNLKVALYEHRIDFKEFQRRIKEVME